MEIIWLFNITTLYVHICYVQTFKTKHKPLWCYCERLINLVKSLKFLFFLRILAKEHKVLCSVLSIMELREDHFGIALNSLKIYKPDIYIYILWQLSWNFLLQEISSFYAPVTASDLKNFSTQKKSFIFNLRLYVTNLLIVYAKIGKMPPLPFS